MAVKKNNYIGADLEFAEEQLETWARYIKANPIEKIKDRWGKKEMPKGGQTMVVTASAEQQIKCVQDTLAKYLQMLEVIDKLRAIDEVKKKAARGSSEVPEGMEDDN